MNKVTKPVDVRTPNPAPVSVPTHASTTGEDSSGSTIVLQWLTYAFWLWYGFSMSWLAGVVINYFVSRDQAHEWVMALAYPLAAVIVMLVICLITDWFYTKREPARKTGGANVLMLLHAVPFVLIAISSLVTMVFALIMMILNNGPVDSLDGPLKVLLVSLTVAVIFGLLAYRVVFGGRRAMARKVAWIVFTVLSLGFIIGAFAGPAAHSALTKQDRLVEEALPELSSNIRRYTRDNDKLPASLQDVTRESSSKSQSVQQALDKKLVTYNPNALPVKTGASLNPDSDSEERGRRSTSVAKLNSGQKRFYYQLCTTYRYEKKSKYSYPSDNSRYTKGTGTGSITDYRSDSMYSSGSHPEGEVCYNLYADGKYTY